jgi:hypothetical protein
MSGGLDSRAMQGRGELFCESDDRVRIVAIEDVERAQGRAGRASRFSSSNHNGGVRAAPNGRQRQGAEAVISDHADIAVGGRVLVEIACPQYVRCLSRRRARRRSQLMIVWVTRSTFRLFAGKGG